MNQRAVSVIIVGGMEMEFLREQETKSMYLIDHLIRNVVVSRFAVKSTVVFLFSESI